MANLLRGAMNLLGGADLAGAPEQGRLVGKSIEIDGRRYSVKTQIAKGGFATVYTCQQAGSGAWYALKSQLAGDSAAVKVILQELKLLKESSHPHIIQYVSSVMATTGSSKEFLMITELCSGGSVIDLLAAGNPLTLAQVANITHGATAAIDYLHSKSPAVTHRDMKVENLLFSSRGFVKLCDFGSATTEEFFPDDTWNAARRTQLEENAQLATTPMYRAPEILDTYLGYPVTRLQDVWALGCVLFYLCYRSHPFEDSAKLRIIYAKYAIPEDAERYAPFRPLIESTLRPDPRARPTAADLQQRIEALAVALDVRVDTAVPGVDTTALTGGEPVGEERGGGGGGRAIERREEKRPERQDEPVVPTGPPIAAAAGGVGQSSTAFSALRGQGLSMFRNLKEKSAAVMQTVQNTYGSKGPELVWLTSRIVIAPQQLEGVPEPLAAQAEESLRNALYVLRRPFKMINLSHRRLRCEYPEAAVDVTFPADATGGQSPPMDVLLSVAHTAGIYLRQAPSEAFVVLLGSEAHSSLAALSLLVYHRVLPQPWCAIELLQDKRRDTPVLLPPSAHRLLDALHKSVQPHFKQPGRDRRLQLVQLTVDHLPTFNNNRTGCRPQLMVYVGGTALWQPQSYEMLRSYEGAAERARVQFGLKKSLVAGDVSFVLAHARMSSLTQRMHQIPMISFNLHTAMIDGKENSLELRKGDLDYAAADEQYVPEDIKLTLTFSHREPAPSPPSSQPGAPRGFYDYPSEIVAARHVVGSTAELDEIQGRFEGGAARRQPARVPAAPAAAAAAAEPAPSQPSGGFFDSLSWDAAPGAAAAAAAAAAPPPPPPPHRAASLAASAAAAPPALSDRFESMMLDSKETPILGKSTSPNTTISVDARDEEEEEVDLLGMGREAPSRPAPPAATAAAATSNLLFDPFDTVGSVNAPSSTPQTLDDLFGGPPVSSSSSSSLNKPAPHRDLDDLFGLGGGGGTMSAGGGGGSAKSNGVGDLLMGDLLGGGSGSSMHRNASAPSFAAAPAKSTMGGGGGGGGFDPFADFLASTAAPAAAASSANSTRSSTPSMQQQQGGGAAAAAPAAARPNYSRSAFDTINATGMTAKPRPSANAFDDLLSAQGFSSSGAGGGMGKTMGDMRRAEEIRDLTPEQIKIRDWTAGKEKNIRALLASLSDVMWESDARWQQPSMANLLTANEVKKYYRKAAIVVHPDKQTGLPHAELAKAIMGELITAWNAFEEAGSPSLA